MDKEATDGYRKSIASFMGGKETTVVIKSIGPVVGFTMPGDSHATPIYELDYDQDWNKLMEVVEELENEGYRIHISSCCCEIERIGVAVRRSTTKQAVLDAAIKVISHFNYWQSMPQNHNV